MVYPRWKSWLILALCAVGLLYASPNMMRDREAQLPHWLRPVNLGLDLQGGVHLLLEVQIGAVYKEQLTSLVEGARSALREARLRYSDLGTDGEALTVKLLDASTYDQARDILRKLGGPDMAVEIGPDGKASMRFTDQAKMARAKLAVEQSIGVVRRRIDELGTREPTIMRQGEDRIVVQLPGESNPERVKELIGKTAKMNFHLVDNSVSPEEAQRGRVPPGSILLPSADSKGPGQYVVRRKVEVGGDALADAQPTFQNNEPVVSFRFNTAGGKKFGEVTAQSVGKQLAIVLDNKVISAPVIREPILGGNGVISGSFTIQGANDLALLLRAGALPAPLIFLEERTVGPDLGADSIKAGAIASVLGVVLVAIFMVVFYGLFGLFADIALAVNMVLLLGALSAMGATLTLPGIAGMVLTMGMAVDANVLIYERMREEARHGRTLVSAMQTGFDRAFTTILDANLAHLMAGLLMFQFGSGPVRGFAVTLAVGVLTSMFTSIWVTRLIMSYWLRWAKPRALPL
jgi:preprotein translocase subunit SecD